jgi:hypothetical protein
MRKMTFLLTISLLMMACAPTAQPASAPAPAIPEPTKTIIDYGIGVYWERPFEEPQFRFWIDPVVENWIGNFDKYSLQPVPIFMDKISVGVSGEVRGTIIVLVWYYQCGETVHVTCGFTAAVDDSGHMSDIEILVETSESTENQANISFTQDGDFVDSSISGVGDACDQHDFVSEDGQIHLRAYICQPKDSTFPLPGIAPHQDEPGQQA